VEEKGALRINSVSAPIGERNAVLCARARTHFVKDFPGPLSIKSVTEGAVAWKTGGRELTVDTNSFLVLNHSEPYSLEIDSRVPVATLCVFFEPNFVRSVCASLATDEIDPAPAPVPFLARLHPKDDRILPRMHKIANTRSASQLRLDEQYLALARDLLLLDRDLNRRVGQVPARRAATREELFRRVRRGQEFLHAHACDDLDLRQLAREACLSPFHFHRTFTRVFGRTPHQYRNELRLERARELLTSTPMTVTDICGAVGFESAASFSLLFRERYGVPPSAFRALSKVR
jgi:transcriptional regulator GlxA family with amidase domain